MIEIDIRMRYAHRDSYSVEFYPSLIDSSGLRVFGFEAVFEGLKDKIVEYTDMLKSMGERFNICLSGDFLNLDKSPCVNFVKGILEDKVV